MNPVEQAKTGVKGNRRSSRANAKTQASRVRLENFSKQWNSGDTLRVFYPIYLEEDGNWSIVVHGQYLHRIDYNSLKSLGRFAVPSNSVMNEDDEVIQPDFLFKFARIARLFHLGEFASRERLILENTKLNKKSKEDAIAELKAEFDKKSPVVGSLMFVSSTECLCVVLDAAGNPVKDKTKLASQDLSRDKANSLHTIIDDKKRYHHINEDGETGYLEVEYIFKSSGNKAQDGRVSPDGLNESDSLAVTHPELFEELIAPMIKQLPYDSDLIKKRNRSFSYCEPERIEKALRTYSVLNGTLLDGFDDDAEEVETLKKNAELLESLSISVKFFDNQEVMAELKADLDAVGDEEKKAIDAADQGIYVNEEDRDKEAAREKEGKSGNDDDGEDSADNLAGALNSAGGDLGI